MTHAKLLGHCSQCEKLCWDPHAVPPQPMNTYDGVRATFMLSDGSLMPLTLCDECIEAPDYDKLWEAVMGGWLHEAKTTTDSPTIRDDYVLKQFSRGTFILDLFYVEKWTEIAP